MFVGKLHISKIYSAYGVKICFENLHCEITSITLTMCRGAGFDPRRLAPPVTWHRMGYIGTHDRLRGWGEAFQPCYRGNGRKRRRNVRRARRRWIGLQRENSTAPFMFFQTVTCQVKVRSNFKMGGRCFTFEGLKVPDSTRAQTRPKYFNDSHRYIFQVCHMMLLLYWLNLPLLFLTVDVIIPLACMHFVRMRLFWF